MPVSPSPAPRRAVRRAALVAAAALAAAATAAGPASAMVDRPDASMSTVATGATSAPAAPAAPAAPTGVPVSAADAGDGSFVPVAAARIADTREGRGLPRGKVGAGATVTTQVTGHDGVPSSGVTAVVVNLTVTNATAGSYVTLYPADVARPNASSINFPTGYTGANLVTVPVSRAAAGSAPAGSLAVYNSLGAVDVVLDVVGYYTATPTATGTGTGASYGGYSPLPPLRAYNTRRDVERSYLPMYDREFREIGWDFGTDLDGQVTALAVNITLANATSGGYVTAWSGAGTKPGTSSVNFRPGVNVANFAIVRAGSVTAPGGAAVPSARFDLSTLGGSADLVVDLVGAFTTQGHGDDARFVPLTAPTRILDTREGSLGAPALASNQTRTFSSAPVATTSTVALAANLTLVGPTAATYLTAWPHGTAKPDVSSVNGNARSIVANGALVGLGPASGTTPGQYDLYNYGGTSNALLDVAGLFVPPPTPTTGSLAAPTRVGG